jgi:replication factor C subunit 3/5
MFFIDKYRPENYKKSFFHEEIYKSLEDISKDDNLPHIIFYGPDGSGKRTMIKLFLTMLFDENAIKKIKNVIYDVNASNNKPSKERVKQSDYHIVIEPKNTNYDKYLIHDIVKEYAQRFPLKVFKTNRKFKVVNINNIDNMSYYAQTSLRRTMEKQTSICRFIMSCQTLSKIIKPLRSRCICIRVPAPEDIHIYEYLLKICVNENMIDEMNHVGNIVKSCNGNIKTALWELQNLKYGYKIKTDYHSGVETIIKLILEGDKKNVNLIRTIINNLMITTIEYSIILKDIIFGLCSIDTISDNAKAEIINKGSLVSYLLINGRRKIIQFDAFFMTAIFIIYKEKNIKK